MGAENFASSGFDTRTVQPVASRYTDWAIPVHSHILRYYISRPEARLGIFCCYATVGKADAYSYEIEFLRMYSNWPEWRVMISSCERTRGPFLYHILVLCGSCFPSTALRQELFWIVFSCWRIVMFQLKVADINEMQSSCIVYQDVFEAISKVRFDFHVQCVFMHPLRINSCSATFSSFGYLTWVSRAGRSYNAFCAFQSRTRNCLRRQINTLLTMCVGELYFF